MKNGLLKRTVAIFAVLVMVLSAMPEARRAAYAADAIASTENVSDFVHLWGEAGWNTRHFVTIGGTAIPVYCVETKKTSPGYFEYDYYSLDSLLSSGRGYDEDVLNGLCSIMELGYPITTTVNGVSLSAEEAQVATQFAVRMWLSSKGVSNVHPNINNDNLTVGGSRKESPTFKNRTSATIKSKKKKQVFSWHYSIVSI